MYILALCHDEESLISNVVHILGVSQLVYTLLMCKLVTSVSLCVWF